MSQRVKKPGRAEDSQAKRRRRRPTGSDADEDGTRSGSNSGGGNGSQSGVWTPRHLSDLKVASIYNRNSAEAPAELYRKDLISAMKLPDSEPLTPDEYWLITDTWKQEWEKGVQVPVNPESLPESQVVVISPVADRSHDFRLPKKKYVRVTHDDFFNPDYHQLVSTAARAEKVCSYDLDDVDAAWLGCANADRVMQTLPIISEFLMEQVIEELELQCWEQVQTILKSQEGLGIEYDENVICDVCRSPESEEGNEMVFCDSCNICVHQACYGITSIPSGSFLCRTCTLGLKPSCILCPNMGGAMKATRSGHKWAHVACAIWIPEVSIGSVEKMEPITKISSIPQSRWSLVCVICKDKSGACIQCSVKTCKTAYHVTCAFKNGLEMKPIIVDENAEDGIKLRSYCQKHSVNTKKEKTAHSGSEEDMEKKKSRAMTAEERSLARAEKLQQIEAEFFKYVRLKDVSQNLAVDMDIVNLVYNYWKLKRKSLNNRPLVPPRPETTQLLTQQQEQDLERMKMFVQLRQDLERVRNLCYMVSRREKLSRSYFRLREQAFQKQMEILSDKAADGLSIAERTAIVEANHGPSVYDQFFSQSGVKCNYKDFESLVTLIAGEERPELVNGVVKTKGKKGKTNENPYKKTFVNGASRRSASVSSLSETEIKGQQNPGRKATRKPLSYLFDTDSSIDNDPIIMSNSTTKAKSPPKKKAGKGRGLKQIFTSDSELDLPITLPKQREKIPVGKRPPIYSDTESDSNTNTKPISYPVVTKGALKEFSGKKGKQKPQQLQLPIVKSTIRVSPLLQIDGTTTPAKKRGRKKKIAPFEAIVPQREAAKKATESIRSVKNPKGKESSVGQDGGESPTSFSLKDFLPKEAKSKEQEFHSGDEKPLHRKSPVHERKVLKSNRKLKTKPKEELNSKSEQRISDLDEDAAAAVSIVPQRQAAKKAAEHIRSCQSSVVAARLIIEDEMEAVKKKSKLEKAGKIPQKLNAKSPTRGRPPSLSNRDLGSDGNDKSAASFGKTSKSKSKSPTKAAESDRVNKLGKKETMKSPTEEESKDSVWPFLDKGLQSACRRSRERSSSSSSSSSGSSSSSDSSSSSHSSSSSRSSSPRSASPVKPQSTHSKPNPISGTGPGRKLKTSERTPNSRVRQETSPRTKPFPKSIGSSASGPRRGALSSPWSPSTEQSTKRTTSNSPNKQQKCWSRSPSRRPSSPDTKFEEKNRGGKGESRVSKETKALTPTKLQQKRTPPKTLIRDELALSSDSEEETHRNNTSLKMRGRSQSRSSNISPDLKNKPMPKTKKRELGLLSEESGSADEKENSCVSPSPADSPRKAQISSVPAPNSLLSPLAHSGENVDNITTQSSREIEPESKRPRLHEHLSTISLPEVQNLPALSISNPGPSMPKSIFSPPLELGKESEFGDFDNDLYDLAKTVSADCNHQLDEGDKTNQSLIFSSFSQDLLTREDNKEDSQMATMNLVEKLRLQHLRKSGVNQRLSLDGTGDLDELNSKEESKTPLPSESPHKFEPSFSTTSTRTNDEGEEKVVCDLSISPRNISAKPIPGDERWVPPSNHFVTTKHHSIFGNENGENNKHVNEQSQQLNSLNLPKHNQQLRMHSQLQLNDDHRPPLEQKDTYEQGLHTESPDFLGNMVSNSPSLPPGISLPPGLTASYAGTTIHPQNFHSSHPSFIPFSNLANVVTSLASGNHPFFKSQSQIPKISPKIPVVTPLSSPTNSYSLAAFSHHFGNLQESTGPGSEGLHSPTEGRRPSESNHLSVTSGMPPLSKPPLTSPSLLLSSNNTLSAPGPPPQSTVAQIIESVIQASNNHSAVPINKNTLSHQLSSEQGTNLTDLNFNHGISSSPFQKLTNTSNDSATFTSPAPIQTQACNKSLVKSPDKITTPASQNTSMVSDFTAVLSNKTNENILPQKITPTRDYAASFIAPNTTVAVSPKGAGATSRGRRAATPKVKQEKAAGDEISPKVRARGERKPSGASPGRGAKGSTTPRRGGGRGKYKGKNVVVRKDLAGTVYDIDFDEFEENTEDKFDLRSLRDRRKSSDIHSSEYRKSESSGESPICLEKQSPRQRIHFENELRYKSTIPPISVDAPSYDSSAHEKNTESKGMYPNNNDPSSTEFASLLLNSLSSSSATVNDLEELDKTLEALSSGAKTSCSVTGGNLHSVNNIGLNARTSQLLHNSSLGPGGDSSLSSSKDSFTTTLSEDNHSRSQLKFKIKGPFLDANYSSHSISQPSFQQTTHPQYFHHPEPAMNTVPIMNNPSNLRRMRKKELLRQYCNQDMNMDGKYSTPSFGSDFGVGGQHFHPYGRAVITIPKAVASMAIIPSGKDDYGLDPSDLGPLPIPSPVPVQEKKKRSRGVNREMAALGLIDVSKEDRWKDSFAGNSPGTQVSDNNSRKRPRAAAKPSRSTFIPPTLADAGDMGHPTSDTSHTLSSLATSLNHTTPKLKIKFADFQPGTSTYTSGNASILPNVDVDHLDNSDKETPAKRVKVRPPKKRGISDMPVRVPTPPSMEELKRQSLMFREMIMKDFDNADASSKSNGSKKKKKSKKSKRAADGEMAGSNRSKSPEMKIITDASTGPKLILRFGKNRAASTASNDSPLNNNNIDGVKKENGPGEPVNIDASGNIGDQDSGFTGSSEGSGGSWTPASNSSYTTKLVTITSLLRTSSKQIQKNREGTNADMKVELKGDEKGVNDQAANDVNVLKFKPEIVVPSTSASTVPTPTSPPLSKATNDKVMPIRLKLHRCYEGYATKKEVDRENTNPKQTDSCEVR